MKPRRNKPSYSATVRIGLKLIAERIRPVCEFEQKAVEWIFASHHWHNQVVAPKTRRHYEQGKERAKK